MRARDICAQLSKLIPTFTSGFSDTIEAISIEVTGFLATVTTASPHGLSEGSIFSVIGATAPVQIDSGTYLRTGTLATFETSQDHDLTLSERDKRAGGKSINISGAAEPELNGTFALARVINRRTLVISLEDGGPTTISGDPIVEDANGGIFNGVFSATNVSPLSFQYELPDMYPLNAAGTPKIQTSLRIGMTLDIAQYISEVYTKQILSDDQLIVQLGDVSQSKNRNEESDASDSSAGQYSYTPILIQPFSIYILQNVTDQVTGAQARDKVESEYIPAIIRSVLLAKFDTGFTYSQHRATFTGHGVFAYSETSQGQRKALYVHEVSFEQLAVLDRTADTAGQDETVAMRDVDYTLPTDLGNTELSATVDLDEEPLP